MTSGPGHTPTARSSNASRSADLRALETVFPRPALVMASPPDYRRCWLWGAAPCAATIPFREGRWRTAAGTAASNPRAQQSRLEYLIKAVGEGQWRRSQRRGGRVQWVFAAQLVCRQRRSTSTLARPPFRVAYPTPAPFTMFTPTSGQTWTSAAPVPFDVPTGPCANASDAQSTKPARKRAPPVARLGTTALPAGRQTRRVIALCSHSRGETEGWPSQSLVLASGGLGFHRRLTCPHPVGLLLPLPLWADLPVCPPTYRRQPEESDGTVVCTPFFGDGGLALPERSFQPCLLLVKERA